MLDTTGLGPVTHKRRQDYFSEYILGGFDYSGVDRNFAVERSEELARHASQGLVQCDDRDVNVSLGFGNGVLGLELGALGIQQ